MGDVPGGGHIARAFLHEPAFGGKRRQIVAKVLMPAALPFLLTGIRLAIGRAIVGVVVGELFGANAGLGYLIWLWFAVGLNRADRRAGVLTTGRLPEYVRENA